MIGPTLALLGFSIALAWAVFAHGGVYIGGWAAALGIVGFTFIFSPKRTLAGGWAIWGLGVYSALQLVPLKLRVLQVLSPARAQLEVFLGHLLPSITAAPLTVNPPLGMAGAFSLVGYILIFFGLRELSGRFQERPWIPVLPLIVLGALEAAIGISGIADNGLGAEDISGTYTNRDHFSGMLEMIFPLAVMAGWAMLRANLKAAMLVCVLWGLGILMFAGILASVSRMGFLAGLASFVAVCALSLGPRVSSRKGRLIVAALMVSAALILLVVLPTVALMERFSYMSDAKGLSEDTRVYLAKGTVSLISEFPWFGIGGGGFESTFLKYQRESHMFRMEMAHNDYLQYLAELGMVGFALLVATGLSVLIPLGRGIVRESDDGRRLLLVGCAGSLVAIGVHSLADFNLHIQANAMILAWIAGIASGNSKLLRG